MDIRKFIINECEDASCKIAVDVREGKKICKYAKSNWTLEEIKKSKKKYTTNKTKIHLKNCKFQPNLNIIRIFPQNFVIFF